MDTREKYRQIIIGIINGHIPRTPQRDAEVTIVTDDKNGHYQVVVSGWRATGYTYGCILHIDLTEDAKVVVCHNGTESMIGDELHAAGIAREDIILAFMSRQAQQAAGFGGLDHAQ